MKRQRLKSHQQYEEFSNNDVYLNDHKPFRPTEPVLKATVSEGDTLASIALRFNTNVAELKRLNKIDKDFEIAAHKTLKIPITPHNVLLDTLPAVHKSSGNNSPNQLGASHLNLQTPVALKHELEEKLIVASVNSSGYKDVTDGTKYEDYPRGEGDPSVADPLDPLLGDMDAPVPNIILARPRNDFSFDGSDCDMNWICLLIVILALCVVIPFIYVFFAKREHDELAHHNVFPSMHHDSSHY